MSIAVKICGITDPAIVPEIVQAGTSYIGLVFVSTSPRFLTDIAARAIALATPHGVKRVGLFVDPIGTDLEATLDTVPLDMLQLHGRETPEDIATIKSRYGLPVIKAIGVKADTDWNMVSVYEEVADWLLFDAPPPIGSDRAGGNGIAFDWSLLSGRAGKRPWMLSGGLTPANVADAIRISGTIAVDVSSGVESAPGVKNAGLVRDFIEATIRL